MKQQIVVGSACLLFVASIAYFSFTSLNKNSSEYSICIDKTDSLQPKPDGEKIYSSLRIGNYKWARTKIRVNTFSNFDYNSASELELPAKLILLSALDKRDTTIEEFKKSFVTKLNDVYKLTIGLPKSSIYGPMIRDLNRLAKSKAENKIAIYLTDCRENTSLFSAYDEKDLTLLKEHPEKVKTIFDQIEKPNDLSAVRVFLICSPTTDEENYGFGLMANFFKKLLIDAGAKVYIGADLEIEEN